MQRIVRRIHSLLAMFGLDLTRTASSLVRMPRYLRDLRTFKRQQTLSHSEFPLGKLYPCLSDEKMESPSNSPYFLQDLLVARRIYASGPEVHADVGSRIDGFVAHVASFRQIRVFDIRDLPNDIPNVEFVRLDLMNPIDDRLAGSCDSLSSLHALEHFGLRRYGDPIRWDGHIHGLRNMHRLLKPGGTLYLSVPIGPQRIEFNAHRVFHVGYLLKLFEGLFAPRRISYIDDHGRAHEDVTATAEAVANNFGCVMGCGIFELKRL